MSYTKTTWVDGDIISAEKLNKMESGIESAYVKPSGGIPKSDLGTMVMPDVEFGELTTLVDTTTLEFSKDGDNDWYCTAENPMNGFVKASFKYDRLYVITWDGTQYECFAQMHERFNSDDNVTVNTVYYEWVGIGNVSGLGYHNYYETDAPFCVAYDFHRNAAEVQVFSFDTETSHTIKIEEIPFVKNVIPTQYYVDTYKGRPLISFGTGTCSIIEGSASMSSGDFAHAEGDSTIASGNGGSHSEGSGTLAAGYSSHSEGHFTYANVDYAHAEGYNVVVDNVAGHGEGAGTKVTGQVSHGEGFYTTVSGTYSHVEGNQSTCSGNASHAEGRKTVSSGSSAHSEGNQTTASGVASHSEGNEGVASGRYSHVEGEATIANAYAMHSQGRFNVSATTYPEWVANTSYAVDDCITYNGSGYKCKAANSDATFTIANWDKQPSNSTIAFALGNGTADNARSNAMTVDWSGNEYLNGDLYVGCNSDATGGTKVATVGDLPDIQINGTSIVNNGIANVPVANANTLGVAKVGGSGLNIVNGQILISRGTSSEIKAGTNNYKPIVPSTQHESTFYALAKAAGDSTQSSSSNSVGTYTEEAKIAIQKMLGIYEPPWELLNTITLSEIGRIDLTTDSDGVPYNLRNVFIDILYPANAATISSGYSRFYFYDANGRYLNAETGRYQTSTSKKYKLIRITRCGNLTNCSYIVQQTVGSQGGWQSKPIRSNPDYNALTASNGSTLINFGNIVRISENSDDSEPEGTIIQIYGQRAY